MNHHGREILIKYVSVPGGASSGFLGVTTGKIPNKFIILINESCCPLVQRHTLGHELAHIFLGHFDQIGFEQDQREREADRHAWEYYRAFKAGTLGTKEEQRAYDAV